MRHLFARRSVGHGLEWLGLALAAAGFVWLTPALMALAPGLEIDRLCGVAAAVPGALVFIAGYAVANG